MIGYHLRERMGKLNLSAFVMAVALTRGGGPFEIVAPSPEDAKYFMSLVRKHLKTIMKDDNNVAPYGGRRY